MKKLAILSLTVAGFAFSAVGCASQEAKQHAAESAPTSSINASVDSQAQTPIVSGSVNADASIGQTSTPATNTPATNAQ